MLDMVIVKDQSQDWAKVSLVSVSFREEVDVR